MLLPITAPEAINMPCGVHNALERYSGPYVGLVHNVRCVSWADIVLATNTRTAPVHADRKVAPSNLIWVLGDFAKIFRIDDFVW